MYDSDEEESVSGVSGTAAGGGLWRQTVAGLFSAVAEGGINVSEHLRMPQNVSEYLITSQNIPRRWQVGETRGVLRGGRCGGRSVGPTGIQISGS
eukprot:SAG31_NODE_1846_length_7103_cov_82.594946_2_plen_95_part_00